LLGAALLCVGHASAAGLQYRTVRAGTADDVINAMLAAGKSGEPTIIRLAAGHYVFSRAFNSAYDPSLLPIVRTTIQIIASNPATTTFELAPNVFPHRFFTVIRGGNLSVHKLTLHGGLEECSANCSKLGGGAAINVGGELQFHDCDLSQNAAFNTEGGEIGGGGAILNVAGHFLLNRSTVTGNAALTTGGAVALLGGKGSIWNSIISGNNVHFGFGHFVTSVAAGIFVSQDASLFITGSTVSGNGVDGDDDDLTALGIGIFNAGTTSLADSAVTENGPVIHNPEGVPTAPGAGGGIYNSGTMSIENSTIGGNSVGTLGGGIYNSGRLQLQGVTLTANLVRGSNGNIGAGGGAFPPGCGSGALQLCVSGGSGIWNEPSGSVTVAQSAIGANEGEDCHGVLTSKGHNAIGDSLNCVLTPSPWLGGRPTHDLVNLDIRLGDLQDNGVPGNAHYPPLADSPLIDAAGSIGPTCSPFDQIGNRRVDGDADRSGANICDVGAIEFQPPPHP